MLFHILLVPDTINRRKCAVLTVDRLFEVSRCNAEQEQLIMTALICFVMGVIEDKKRICIKDTDSKKDRTVLRPDDKKNNRKNKIIYWNEPRIQNRINRAVYFNTG